MTKIGLSEKKYNITYMYNINMYNDFDVKLVETNLWLEVKPGILGKAWECWDRPKDLNLSIRILGFHAKGW